MYEDIVSGIIDSGALLVQSGRWRCCYLCQTAMAPNCHIVPEGYHCYPFQTSCCMYVSIRGTEVLTLALHQIPPRRQDSLTLVVVVSRHNGLHLKSGDGRLRHCQAGVECLC